MGVGGRLGRSRWSESRRLAVALVGLAMCCSATSEVWQSGGQASQ